jgi:hypothetical protein
MMKCEFDQKPEKENAMRKLSLLFVVALLTMCTAAGAAEMEILEVTWCEVQEEEEQLTTAVEEGPCTGDDNKGACCSLYAYLEKYSCLNNYENNAYQYCLHQYLPQCYQMCMDDFYRYCLQWEQAYDDCVIYNYPLAAYNCNNVCGYKHEICMAERMSYMEPFCEYQGNEAYDYCINN